MTERDFWRTTPRKLDALAKVHIKINSYDETQEEAKTEKKATLGDLIQLAGSDAIERR